MLLLFLTNTADVTIAAVIAAIVVAAACAATTGDDDAEDSPSESTARPHMPYLLVFMISIRCVPSMAADSM